MKALNVSEGLQLLKRYNRSGGIGADLNDACKDARVWKSSRNAIESMSNTLLANAVLNAEDDIDVDTLQDLLNEWAVVNESTLRDDFPTVAELIRKSVMIAKCSKAMYPFCSFLIEVTLY